MPSRTRDLPIAPVNVGVSSVLAPGIPSDRAIGGDAAETSNFPGFSTPANPARFALRRAPFCAGIARPKHLMSGVIPGRVVPAPGGPADAPPIGDDVAFGPSPAVSTGLSACGASAGRAVPNHRTGPGAPFFHSHVPRVEGAASSHAAAVRLAAGCYSDAADPPGGIGVHTVFPAPGESVGTAVGLRHHGHRSGFIPRTGGTPADHFRPSPRRADTRDARQPAGTGHIPAPENTAARDVPARAAGAVHSIETASISGEASASPPRGMTERNPMNERRPGPGVTHA